jgi:hypothetical protein
MLIPSVHALEGFMDFELDKISEMIYVIRGVKVMFDIDLAKLYGVETRVLNQAAKRNLKRFPADFMFKLTSSVNWGGKRKQPLVFTENSDRAIEVNIAIMRTSTKLRSFQTLEKELTNRMDCLEIDTTEVFKIVFEKLDGLDKQIPSHSKDRNKIGVGK